MAIRKRKTRLRRGDREVLEGRLRTRTAPQRPAERARIVLGSAEGLSGYELSEKLGISGPTVQRWLDRSETHGVAGLEDRPRSGRPKRITPEVEAEVVREALEEAVPRGTHWSTRLMVSETELHASEVSQICRAHGLKAHGVKTFKLSRDPRFVEKLRDVVGLYLGTTGARHRLLVR